MSDEELEIYMTGFMKGAEAENNLMKAIIRAKIKKLQTRIESMHGASDCVVIDELETKIETLEELLEEE